MVELIVSFMFVFLFSLLMFNNVNLRLKNNLLINQNLQIAIDRNIFAEKLLEEINSSETKSIENTDGFLKFVSQSRDWAFDYIEDVQKAVGFFINDIEPEIKYFDEYGVVGDAYPHYHSMKKISEAYKELKKIMPDDYGKLDT